MVKVHYISSGDEAEGGTVNEMTTGGETAEETDDDRDAGVPASAIDDLTGKAYSLRLRSSKSLECPYPDLGGLADTDAAGHSTSAHRSACAYVFSRPYDLRRHLKAEHGVLVDKKRVELWVESWKSPSAP